MPNQKQKNNHQPLILRLLAGDRLSTATIGMVFFALLTALFLGLGMTSVVIAAFVTYGFSSSLLLFLLLVAAITTAAQLLGTVSILGPALYWFVIKEPILSTFQGYGLEHSLLTALIAWSGLAASIYANLNLLLGVVVRKRAKRKQFSRELLRKR